MKNYKTKIIVIVTSILLLIGVYVFIKKNLFNYGGNVIQKDFFVKIPYNFKNGLIYLTPVIEGKKYNFILDTGAYNTVSKEMSEELELADKQLSKSTDSQGNTNEVSITKIPNINLGGIDFENYRAAIIGLSEQLYCLGIDGIIGSNLMKDVIWEIDQKNKIITITNSIRKLDLKGYNENISFFTDKQFTPYVKISLAENLSSDIMIDTGYTDGILLTLEEELIPKDSIVGRVNIKGNSDFGVFKKEIKEIDDSYIKLNSVRIDNSFRKNVLIYFMQNSKNKIGNSFFRGYNYILDWNSKNILLKKHTTDIESEKVSSFGFNWSFLGNKVLVSKIIESSKASNYLKINDQIIKFNNEDWSSLEQEKWCESNNEKLPDTILVTIKRKDSIKDFMFTRKVFIK